MHEATLAAILDAADEGWIVFDLEEKCAYAGRRIGEIFGVDATSIVGGPQADVLELLASACEEPSSFHEIVRGALVDRGSSGEIELRRPRLRVARFSVRPIDDPKDGRRLGWIGCARDVTRERSAERRSHQLLQRLETITAIDALTQLPNKRRFFEELEREHGRAARAWDSYAILRIDIDGLTELNAELGTPRGDEALEHVAARLREGRREYDLLARLEADEFIVLLPGADLTAARVVGERMSTNVSRAPLDLGGPRPVSVCIGAAVWVPPSGETGADVAKRSGEALGRAKKKGESALVIDGEEAKSP